MNFILLLPKVKNIFKILTSNIELPYDTAFHFWVYTEKNWKQTRTDICTPIFTAALFTVPKRWEQPKGPSTEEQMNKMGSMPAVEHHSALKRKETLAHATTRTHLKDITLHVIIQLRITKTVWFHLCEVPTLFGFIETECWFPGVERTGDGMLLLNGCRVSMLGGVLYTDGGAGGTTV